VILLLLVVADESTFCEFPVVAIIASHLELDLNYLSTRGSKLVGFVFLFSVIGQFLGGDVGSAGTIFCSRVRSRLSTLKFIARNCIKSHIYRLCISCYRALWEMIGALFQWVIDFVRYYR
jgi:hypothetical protein